MEKDTDLIYFGDGDFSSWNDQYADVPVNVPDDPYVDFLSRCAVGDIITIILDQTGNIVELVKTGGPNDKVLPVTN